MNTTVNNVENVNEIINIQNLTEMDKNETMVATQNAAENRKAVPATASNNPLTKSNMTISTVETLLTEGKQIVFLAFNRDVTDRTPHVKRLAKSIKEEGLHTPLHLVPAAIALEEGIELLDDRGSSVTDATNKYVLVDGNNKYRAILLLRASHDAGKAVEPIKCIIDEGAKEIQRMVMTMNNVVKPWSNADAIKAASQTKPNEVVDFIAEKVKDGFPFSTISIVLTGQNNKITKDLVMRYISGTGELPMCDLVNGKKKLDAMTEAGFSSKFIKSRYLIETISYLVFQGYKLDDVLVALKKYTPAEVQFAQDRRDLSLLEIRTKELSAANN